MGVTRIEWTNFSFNPWWGCARVSPGCRFCYADRDAKRYGHELWRRHGERRMLSEDNWRKPLKWNRDAERAQVPAKVFCASMADVFEDHPDVVAPRERLWGVIEATPWLHWQILTKRPENVARMAPWGDGWPAHVWLGVSVENQRYADERIPLLLASGAKTLFLSCEPLLGPVDLSRWMPPGRARWQCGGCRAFFGGDWQRFCPGCGREGYWCGSHTGNDRPNDQPLSWVIVGGESGSKARPMRPGWARSLRDQCQAAQVPFLFKQWGSVRWVAGSRWDEATRCWVDDGIVPQRVSKKLAGRELDGRTWDEFPNVAEMTGAA
jgi:protein gp37